MRQKKHMEIEKKNLKLSKTKICEKSKGIGDLKSSKFKFQK